MEINDIFPLLIPIVVVQFILLAYTIWHILRADSYKRWQRAQWLTVAIVGMTFIGPILYFLFGKKDE